MFKKAAAKQFLVDLNATRSRQAIRRGQYGCRAMGARDGASGYAAGGAMLLAYDRFETVCQPGENLARLLTGEPVFTLWHALKDAWQKDIYVSIFRMSYPPKKRIDEIEQYALGILEYQYQPTPHELDGVSPERAQVLIAEAKGELAVVQSKVNAFCAEHGIQLSDTAAA